eukprot:Seg247.2 transcript_id=Seg247.2/GoldUCD/mRNA.D3Y31 product="hypothetical protein" protein_id=Seg247.2/GoldUCD/D3Y31
MSGPPKKAKTLESFFSKSSRTSSVGPNTETSGRRKSATDEELGPQPTVAEFETPLQVTAVQDVPKEETHPGVGSTAAQANVAGSDRYDIGRVTSESGGGRGAQYGGGAGQSMGKLVNKPLVDFSDLTGKNGALTSQQESSFHKTCVIKYTEFLNRARPGCEKDVQSIINTERQKEIERNRAALVPIIDTLLTCARQNIAMRGHRDDGPVDSTGEEPMHNDGNFRALLRLRVRGGDTSDF